MTIAGILVQAGIFKTCDESKAFVLNMTNNIISVFHYVGKRLTTWKFSTKWHHTAWTFVFSKADNIAPKTFKAMFMTQRPWPRNVKFKGKQEKAKSPPLDTKYHTSHKWPWLGPVPVWQCVFFGPFRVITTSIHCSTHFCIYRVQRTLQLRHKVQNILDSRWLFTKRTIYIVVSSPLTPVKHHPSHFYISLIYWEITIIFLFTE